MPLSSAVAESYETPREAATGLAPRRPFSRGQRVAAAVGRTVAILAITAVLFELVTRSFLGIAPMTKENLVWAYDPELGWWHEPGKKGVFVKLDCRQPVAINAHGLREREIGYDKPPGVFRVLVLGDSVAVGFEVSQDRVFTRVLEDELNRAVAGSARRFEVINGACRGWGTDQSLIFLKREGLRYKPDLILYCYCGNDPYDNTELHRPFRVFGKGYFALGPGGSLTLKDVPVPAYQPEHEVYLDEAGGVIHKTIPPSKSRSLWLRDNVACRSAGCALALQVLSAVPAVGSTASRWSGYVSDRKIPAGAAAIRAGHPYKVTLALTKAMKAAAEGAGARFAACDPASRGDTPEGFSSLLLADLGIGDWALRREAERGLPRGASMQLRYDAHLSVAGHRATGEALARALVSRGFLPTRGAEVVLGPR
jgi:hypothetical protein